MDFFAKLKEFFGGKKKGGSAQAKLPRINVTKRFDLLGRTGQGSMSKVWRARDRNTARTVCLKILDKLKTAKFEARFQGMKRPSEGALLVGLKHPNIVQAHEHGLTTDKEQYIVMELIEGKGLNYLIETHDRQLQGNRVNYLTQLAEALEYVHKQGFLHRDICPRNVMIGGEGVVKLIDFGLAVPYKPEFCKPGNRTGTPDYLAPEIIKRLATDHRVDLFALGVTAYEMYTGTMPWEKAESMQVLQSHIRLPGLDPREVLPDMDDATAQFLIKAIEREPRDRYQTAAAFREALQQLPQA